MKKILVVDDEPALQEMLKDILALANFSVSSAGNGAEGLRMLAEDKFDLLIIDCSMPVLDGYEMLERMRADPMLVNQPVIMLTVKSSENDEIRGLKLGVDDYITKPFKPSLLLARIKAVLERKAQSISANPLTALCGNEIIKKETEKRIVSGAPFAMIYADIANFKSFNDRYGFERGDEVIKHTASVLLEAVRERGAKGDFVGHIGGDDFIILTTPENGVPVCEQTIALFDAGTPSFYDPADRAQGYIVSTDRNNAVQRFPLMTIALAVIATDNRRVVHYAQLSEIAAELKKEAKKKNRSAFVVDRRNN